MQKLVLSNSLMLHNSSQLDLMKFQTEKILVQVIIMIMNSNVRGIKSKEDNRGI